MVFHLKCKYPIHPDFRFWSHVHPPVWKPLLPTAQKALSLLSLLEQPSEKLDVLRERIPVPGGAVSALRYVPAGIGPEAPCLVYFHGGGFVYPAAPYHYSLARIYALKTPCQVLFADYRLAPRHPFPTPPEDCFAVYGWALAHCQQLSLDPSRVAVAGDSAGGQLAAVAALMARDRGRPLPRGQMLLYPATDLRMQTPSMAAFPDTPMCSSGDMKKYRRLYLRDGLAGPRAYASPLEAETLAGLPPAYVETAEFDCLRDEGIQYARRLQSSGVETALRCTKSTLHGYDIALQSPIVRESVKHRILFLRKIFGLGPAAEAGDA